MKKDVFAGVIIALTKVTMTADRLLDGDAEGHVRRSIDEFGVAFARRETIGPAFARMRNSIVMLQDCRNAGARRAFERDKPLIQDLHAAIEERLLPELQRLGFDLNPWRSGD
jgi:hypothetical protein